MLASWRKTCSTATVVERMGAAFGDAAVSITITSLTGLLMHQGTKYTTIPCRYRFLQYWCIHCIPRCEVLLHIHCHKYALHIPLPGDFSAQIPKTFHVLQITFFGAIMTLSGYREHQNRHALLMIKLKTSYDAGETSGEYERNTRFVLQAIAPCATKCGALVAMAPKMCTLRRAL